MTLQQGALLVSFCNQREREAHVLGVIGAGGEIRRWLDVSPHRPTSACGIAFWNQTLYCACSDEDGSSYIAIFDASASLRDYVAVRAVGDIHSICTDGASLFAASTASDEIVRLPISNLGGRAETLWRAGNREQDLNHVNGVAFVANRLLCSGFGARNGPAWADACDGFIYDISGAAYILRGLLHPHSLVEHRGELYFCESADGSMRSVNGAVRYVDGYSRGLAFDGRWYYVGASRGRRSNVLTRYVLNPADPGVRSGRCAIYRSALDDASQLLMIDLGGFADEIYDVLPLPEAMYAAI